MTPKTYHFLLGVLTILLVLGVVTFNIIGVVMVGLALYALHRWYYKKH